MRLTFVAGVLAVAMVPAFMLAREPNPQQKPRRVAPVTPACAMDLGRGIKTKRAFCDIIIASTPAESVSVPLPPHAGPATLMFDLHNRFVVPQANTDPKLAFTNHAAVVAVIRLTGDVIDRGAVSREYRTPSDLFDRLAGTGRGALPKAVAPGQPQDVRITIPPGINVVGIVGVRLEEWRASGRAAFDTPNKPIAVMSNLRVEFTPR